MNIDIVILKALSEKDNYLQYRKYFDDLFSDTKHTLAPLFKAFDALALGFTDSVGELENISPESLSLKVYETSPFLKKSQLEFIQQSIENIRQVGQETWDFSKLLGSFKKKEVATRIALLAVDVADGKEDSEKLYNLVSELQSIPGNEVGEGEKKNSPFVQGNLSSLLQRQNSMGGLNWRLKCLRQSLGPLRKGDFGFIFARPETGKTTFLASEISSFLEQTDQPILWFNNEEQGDKVYLRVMQGYFGVALDRLQGHAEEYEKSWEQRGFLDRFRLYDDARINRDDVVRTVEQLQPGCIIFDQIDKLKGFADDRNDLELGNIYIWAREIAKQYCPVIGVCQAGGTAENKAYLTMDDVVNAKTSKQAEADWILGIGAKHDEPTIRYLNISKNKLIGGPESDNMYRHGKFQTIIQPQIARYEDI